MPGIEAHSQGGSWSPVRQTEDRPSPPPPAEQKDTELRLNNEASREGDEVNLVSSRWWRRWKRYLGEEIPFEDQDDGRGGGQAFDSDMFDAFGHQTSDSSSDQNPGPVDNSHLVEPIAEADQAVTSKTGFTGKEGFSWRLQRDLVEREDYILVPNKLWRVIMSWHGGGPEISRFVVSSGRTAQLGVEVYPLTLQLIFSSAPKHPRSITISKRATVEQLQRRVCEMLNKREAEVRLWDYFGCERQKLLDDLQQVLEDAELQMDNEIFVEEATAEGKWPEVPSAADVMEDGEDYFQRKSLALVVVPEQPAAAGIGPLAGGSTLSIAGGPLSHYRAVEAGAAMDFDPRGRLGEGGVVVPKPSPTYPTAAVGGSEPVGTGLSSSLSLASSSSYHTARTGGSAGHDESSTSSGFGVTLRSSQQHGGKLLGLTGLVNLGNTCFMNSALQCLAHTPPLVDYFLNFNYSAEINRSNPLGMEGEIAHSFGELLKRLWSLGYEPVAPRAFKARLSRFAPQFMGYNQHDSQELLAFLLDGLHEDLNRVLRKPYIEAKDGDDRPDEIVAAEYWKNHLARNNSIIVDTCQGQYKSTLVCPACNKVSVTFDPFMYLSLPLPSKSVRAVTVTVIAASGSVAPCTVTVNVLKSGNVGDLVRLLATDLNLPESEQLVIAEIYQSKVHQVFLPHKQLNSIMDQDKLVAYRVPCGCPNPVIVNQRARPSHGMGLYTTWQNTGTPFVISEPRVLLETGEQLYKFVRNALRPFKLGKEHGDPPAASGRGDPKGKQLVQEPDPMDEEGDPGEPYSSREGDGQNGRLTDSRAQYDGFSTRIEPNADPSDAVSGGEGSGSMERNREDVASDSGRGVAGESDGDEKQQLVKKARISNGFKLRFCRDDKKADWVEIADSADPLPSEFFIAGTLGVDGQPVALDWAPRALGQIYDMKVLEELPIVGASQSGFWRIGIPGMGSRVGGSGAYNGASVKGKEGVSLYACLDSFLTEEPLGPDDMWFCPKCKEHRQATKKLDLWRLPDILVVHLKRFSYSRYFKNKIDTFVDFPLKGLDLSPYVRSGKAHGVGSSTGSRGSTSSSSSGSSDKLSAGSGESAAPDEAAGGSPPEQLDVVKAEGEPGKESFVYDLYAVSNHFGGMGGGHYTAFAKHPDDGKWYCFDDSYVTPISEGSVRSSAAYVLFYQRVKK